MDLIGQGGCNRELIGGDGLIGLVEEGMWGAKWEALWEKVLFVEL